MADVGKGGHHPHAHTCTAYDVAVRPTRRSSATSADSRALGDGGAHTHAVGRHLSRLGQRRQELGRLRARERAAATPEIAKVSRRSIRGTEYFHGVSWRFVNFFYEFKCWFHVLVFAVSGIYTKYYPPSRLHFYSDLFHTRWSARTKGKGGLERSRRPPAASSNNSSHLEFFHSRGGKGGSKPRRPRRPPAPAGPPFGDSTSQQRWAAAPTAAARRRVEVTAARATCACVHTFLFLFFFVAGGAAGPKRQRRST